MKIVDILIIVEPSEFRNIQKLIKKLREIIPIIWLTKFLLLAHFSNDNPSGNFLKPTV